MNMDHGGSLTFLMEEVQYAALGFMGLVYVAKVAWLLRKPTASDKAPLKGSRARGVFLSMGNIFMPWAMESTRLHWYFYMEFVIFHLAVAMTILSTFLLPLRLMVPGDILSRGVALFMAAGFLVGVRRLWRRLSKPEIRLLSSIDDYFAIVILDLFFLAGIWALTIGSAESLWVFFLMTTFFLIYVPFSKISHYITYPFARWYYGIQFGGRGVLNRSAKSSD